MHIPAWQTRFEEVFLFFGGTALSRLEYLDLALTRRPLFCYGNRSSGPSPVVTYRSSEWSCLKPPSGYYISPNSIYYNLTASGTTSALPGECMCLSVHYCDTCSNVWEWTWALRKAEEDTLGKNRDENV